MASPSVIIAIKNETLPQIIAPKYLVRTAFVRNQIGKNNAGITTAAQNTKATGRKARCETSSPRKAVSTTAPANPPTAKPATSHGHGGRGFVT